MQQVQQTARQQVQLLEGAPLQERCSCTWSMDLHLKHWIEYKDLWAMPGGRGYTSGFGGGCRGGARDAGCCFGTILCQLLRAFPDAPPCCFSFILCAYRLLTSVRVCTASPTCEQQLCVSAHPLHALGGGKNSGPS